MNPAISERIRTALQFPHPNDMDKGTTSNWRFMKKHYGSLDREQRQNYIVGIEKIAEIKNQLIADKLAAAQKIVEEAKTQPLTIKSLPSQDSSSV